jgi:nucleoside-diphosphate-sugar epimerase
MDPLRAIAGRKVLVTGGTGTLGGAFVARAREAGAQVSAPSRAEGFDLRDHAKVEAELRTFQPEMVFHFAAAGVSQAMSEAELSAINVTGLGNLLTAAASLTRLPKCLLLGSCSEYAISDTPLTESSRLDPRNAYALSKVAGAELAREFADRLPLLWLRMFNVYGGGERLPRLLPYLLQCARQGVVAEVTAGGQLLDYTSAPSAAALFLRLGLVLPDRPGWRVCNVGSGRPITLKEFMEAAQAALSRRGLRLELRFGARPYRPGDGMVCLPDLTRLGAMIGPPEAESLAAGLDAALATMMDAAAPPA